MSYSHTIPTEDTPYSHAEATYRKVRPTLLDAMDVRQRDGSPDITEAFALLRAFSRQMDRALEDDRDQGFVPQLLAVEGPVQEELDLGPVTAALKTSGTILGVISQTGAIPVIRGDVQ